MITELFHSERGVLEYLETGAGDMTIVLLPPGLGRLEHFAGLIEILARKYHVISVNFPGISKSRLYNPNIKSTAVAVEELLRSLQIRQPVLIGESYGGNVAIQLIENIPVRACLLLASGEYFNEHERKFLQGLFLPAMKNDYLKTLYAGIIKQMTFIELHNLKDVNLDQIAARWWDILDYSLPKRQYHIPAGIFWPVRDGILRKGSLHKLLSIFPSARVISVASGHHDIYTVLGKSHFNGISAFLEAEIKGNLSWRSDDFRVKYSL